MNNDKNLKDLNPLIFVFFIQIALLITLGILFIIGRVFEEINLGVFFFSIVIGALGASVSVFKKVKTESSKFKKEYNDIKWWSILIPILYGTVLSGISYLLFMSGILSGDGGNGLITTNLFPNFSNTHVYNDDLLSQFKEIKPSSMQDAGKLLVWSFLSGYSETFVLQILNKLRKNTSTDIDNS